MNILLKSEYPALYTWNALFYSTTLVQAIPFSKAYLPCFSLLSPVLLILPPARLLFHKWAQRYHLSGKNPSTALSALLICTNIPSIYLYGYKFFLPSTDQGSLTISVLVCYLRPTTRISGVGPKHALFGERRCQ